jgi:hypothetical protein
MWKGIVISLIIIAVIGSSYVFANPLPTSSELDKVNHALREAIVQHEPEQALDLLERLKSSILAADLSKVGSVRGVRLLLDSVEQLDRNLHAVKPDFSQIGRMGTRVYFAVDALTHKGQPAWLSVEQVFRRHIQDWQSAVTSKASGLARQQWLKVWDVWQQIEPAAWMNTTPSAMEQAQSWLQATNRVMRGKLNDAKLSALLRFKQDAIDGLFHHTQPTLQSTTIVHAPESVGWGLPASIAALILTVLSAIAIYTRKKPYTSRVSPTETK